MLKGIKIFRAHGVQYLKDLRNARVSPLFMGRPHILQGSDSTRDELLVRLCPASAITSAPLQIDLGKCIFCRECEFANPGRIQFTNDYRMAANRKEDLMIREGGDKLIRLFEPAVRPEIRKIFKHALKLRQVSAGGDNSCEMELNAAGNVNFDLGRYGVEFVASPRHADGVVITGPLTSNMEEALQITWDAVPSPKILILVGADAISGGIFEGSKAISRQFLNDHPVDLLIPGNPAHPLTFINGIMDLLAIQNK